MKYSVVRIQDQELSLPKFKIVEKDAEEEVLILYSTVVD